MKTVKTRELRELIGVRLESLVIKLYVEFHGFTGIPIPEGDADIAIPEGHIDPLAYAEYGDLAEILEEYIEAITGHRSEAEAHKIANSVYQNGVLNPRLSDVMLQVDAAVNALRRA
jgi:hypothetical protein